MLKRKKLVAMCFSLIFLVMTTSAQAIPEFINYQGVLKDSVGDPVNTTINMTFRIYDADTAGNTLWNETQLVTVVGGVYSVKLGSATPLTSLAFDIPYWLTSEVENDGEMTPRQALNSTPFAVTAATAESVDWPNITNVPTDMMPGGGIIMWSGTIASIPAGWVLCDGTNGTPNLLDRFVVGAGGTYPEGSSGGVSNHTHGPGSYVAEAHSHNVTGSTSTNSSTIMVNGTPPETAVTAYHTHDINITSQNTSASVLGDSASTGNLPPYYSLAYIMKL